MFEHYTDKATRVIFFARYEASAFGSGEITAEHMLLGLLREHRHMVESYTPEGQDLSGIREEIERATPPGKRTSTSVDLPLSRESKQILADAAEEAERLASGHIDTQHLLLALLRQQETLAGKILWARGLRLPELRIQITQDGERGSHVHYAARRNGMIRFLAEGDVQVSEHPYPGWAPRIGDSLILDTPLSENIRYRVTDVTWQANDAGGELKLALVTVRLRLD